MQEIQVWFLHREDSLEKEMATHSSILALRISGTEEPGSLVHGVSRVGHNWMTKPPHSKKKKKKDYVLIISISVETSDKINIPT